MLNIVTEMAFSVLSAVVLVTVGLPEQEDGQMLLCSGAELPEWKIFLV